MVQVSSKTKEDVLYLFKLPGVNAENSIFSIYIVSLCQAQNAVVSTF